MIIIPIAKEPEHCPKCGMEEDRVEICKFCKHEYDSETELTWFDILLFLLIIFGAIILFIFVLDNVVDWLGQYGDAEGKSLVQLFWEDIVYISELKVF